MAVNGPPGTGKTALLQSIIATETVVRALKGGEPAIIVGCSFTNQAVTNINLAMNNVLAENRSGERLPWARRWVPDAPTYGLYLPSEERAPQAEADGFRVALRKGSRAWTGFPDREVDPDYVTQASAGWIEGFKEVYSIELTEPEEGLARIREDLEELLAKVRHVGTVVRQWDKVETWWRNLTTGLEPKAYIDQRQVGFRDRVVAAEAVVEAQIHTRETTRLEHEEAVCAARRTQGEAVAQVTDVAQHLEATRSLKIRLETAEAPQGWFELALNILPGTRHFVQAWQHKRRLEALQPQEHVLFHAEFDNRDGSVWQRRVDSIIQEIRQTHQRAVEVSDNLASNLQNAEAARRHAARVADQAVTQARKAVDDIRAAHARELTDLGERICDLDEARKAARITYDELRRRTALAYSDPEAAVDRPDWLAVVDRVLDVSIRHEMFQKAMRYWEGRWIVEARKLCRDPSLRSKNSAEAALARFRRWCMLTPCLVSTLHSLPNRMRFSQFRQYDENGTRVFSSDFLLEGIDLLIMDEAGQIGPHIGMAAFGLAQRAVVVGDVHQLEPILSIPKGTDRANAIKCGLSDSWSEDDAVTPLILGEAPDGLLGSIMRVVQLATSYTTAGNEREPGIFLSEHRRCDPAIIGFCNDLIYQGRLRAMTPARPKAREMRAWGWAHVQGSCIKRGTSRLNVLEAQAIVDWIAKRSQGEHGWLASYSHLDPKKYDAIEKIVAVLTPFSAQSSEIRKLLRAKGAAYERVTVGTVDALQGAERPIVIFSPTYSADPRPPRWTRFDDKPNFLNVTVSRAEDSFVVIGDIGVLRGGNSRKPSSRLAEFFYAPENELTDVEGNYGFRPEILTKAKRYSTLEGHRQLLKWGFERARVGEALVIVSPFITQYAVDADDIARLCELTISNGATVHIIVDHRSANDAGKRSADAIAALEKAGASVHVLKGTHSKTLIVGNRAIAEGSFNWLSAMRDRTNQYFNLEASYLVTGISAKADIERAILELNDRGAKIH